MLFLSRLLRMYSMAAIMAVASASPAVHKNGPTSSLRMSPAYLTRANLVFPFANDNKSPRRRVGLARTIGVDVKNSTCLLLVFGGQFGPFGCWVHGWKHREITIEPLPVCIKQVIDNVLQFIYFILWFMRLFSRLSTVLMYAIMRCCRKAIASASSGSASAPKVSIA